MEIAVGATIPMGESSATEVAVVWLMLFPCPCPIRYLNSEIVNSRDVRPCRGTGEDKAPILPHWPRRRIGSPIRRCEELAGGSVRRGGEDHVGGEVRRGPSGRPRRSSIGVRQSIWDWLGTKHLKFTTSWNSTRAANPKIPSPGLRLRHRQFYLDRSHLRWRT